MILTHFIMFEFFTGATSTADVINLATYSKIHQGVGLAL